MLFVETKIPGAYIIDLEKKEDDRGIFARTFCQQEFAAHGLDPRVVQCSISSNKRKGTLRGLHYQAAPYQEVKLVRCTMGGVYDVAVDLRRSSPTFRQWVAVELTAKNRRMFYIPAGLAHGFETLEDETELFYQMSESYHPESAQAIRWNDPTLCVTWPIADPIVSPADNAAPRFSDQDSAL